ncbi:MAG: GerMN domain-containing protein [Acidimicrobiia bacterium]|nr:GerMN domain-containing protein [Acidimicrobiia bacterium]MDH5238888.1 GerMN domain-containing protein [Acidimicrobiia bacterium]
MRSFLGPSLLAIGLLFATGCGSDEASDTGTTTTVASTTSAESSSTTTGGGTTTLVDTTTTAATGSSTTSAPAPDGADVNVYWSWTIPTVASGTPERLGAGGRPADEATPASAMAALLAGPSDIEAEIGMGSEIPTGTELLGVEVDDGTATVDLNAAFEESSGTLAETLRIAQVVFTLTQFDDIDTVRFRIDGVDVDALGSHGIDVSSGLDRDGFTDVRAHIMVETPTPGAVVGDRLVIEGESNTFEANVLWVVTDGEGLIVAEGNTTADGGNGTWGRFETVVELPADLSGRGAVIVFDESAEDGSQVDVVEYPVEFA